MKDYLFTVFSSRMGEPRIIIFEEGLEIGMVAYMLMS